MALRDNTPNKSDFFLGMPRLKKAGRAYVTLFCEAKKPHKKIFTAIPHSMSYLPD
jgi:hypothetical protein